MATANCRLAAWQRMCCSDALALPEASFTEAQLLEKPGRFATSLFRGTGRRLQVLNANNLL